MFLETKFSWLFPNVIFTTMTVGTPSLAKPCMIDAIVSEIAHCTHLVENAEVNLEANPTSTEVKKLR